MINALIVNAFMANAFLVNAFMANAFLVNAFLANSFMQIVFMHWQELDNVTSHRYHFKNTKNPSKSGFLLINSVNIFLIW